MYEVSIKFKYRIDQQVCPVHEGAFYQLFVRLSSATSFEPIFGNIDVPLGIGGIQYLRKQVQVGRWSVNCLLL